MKTKKTNRRKVGKKRKTSKKKEICSPAFEGSFTCFSKKALVNIINSWNETNKSKKIQFNKNETKKILWNKLNDKFKSRCDDELCWIKQDFIKNETYLKLKYFKPLMPKQWKNDINTWLNTFDIAKVMKQYENKYKDFYFIGPVPIDFDAEISPGMCVIDELCKIDIKSLINKKKTKLGVIFNMDKHNQQGSHWVSFFTDFDKEQIYYFDSYGYQEPHEIKILIDRLKEQGKALNKNMEYFYNNNRHQYKNSECGVYSIHFILKLLENKPYSELFNNIIDDDTMQENRRKYFNDKEE